MSRPADPWCPDEESARRTTRGGRERPAVPGRGEARYAGLWVPHLPAVALARSLPEGRGQPLAAMAGTPGAWAVLAPSAAAAARGVRPGMSAGEAVTRVPDLLCLARDPAAERSAAGALLDLAFGASPRVMVVGPGCVVLDLAGLPGGPTPAAGAAGPQGGEAWLGERLCLGATSLDLPVHVGIAGTRTAARLAARAAPGITIVPPGATGSFLAPHPVALLEPSSEVAATLDRWGVRTLGALAALPPAGLLHRLGVAGARLQALARGEDDGPFVPHVPAEPCAEAITLDWEITALDGLAFALRPVLERLCGRLAARGAGARVLGLTLDLATGGPWTRRLDFRVPLRAPKVLLAAVRVELEAQALPAPVVGLRLEAEPAPLEALQTDLFGPSRPSPRELGETLGRLEALVGQDRVGAPALGDTHQPAAIAMVPFVPPAGREAEPRRRAGGSPAGPVARQAAVAALGLSATPALACRRLVPPRPAAVAVTAGAPVSVEAAGIRGRVVASAGPWRTAGAWWTHAAWDREEWDVALPDGAVYRLALDRTTGAWAVDAVYD